MSTTPVGLERRVGQRFAFHLPVSLRDIANDAEGLGCTQDVSSRGAFLFTDLPVKEGSEIELTLKMPSEITLGESMRVRCRGRILRVTGAAESLHAEMRFGVAVCLKAYEYLPEVAENSVTFSRIAALHGHHEEDRPTAPPGGVAAHRE
jgi:PilZ domain-containing protein